VLAAARSAGKYHAPSRWDGARGGSAIRSPKPDERRLKDELARVERELEAANRELERLRGRIAAEIAEREALVALVSHELRTPLTVVSGFNKLLLSERVGKLNAEQRRFLLESERSCGRLDAFIGNLIEAARQAAREGPLDLCDASLEAAVRGVVETLRPLAEERGQRVDVRLAPEAARARFHPLRIEQVLTNLLSNAIRFAPKGGRIEIATRRLSQDGAEHVEVAVADDGPGVPAADRERIFLPWVRGGAPGDGGLGLGLAICKHLVEAHGGTLGVGESAEGGARFAFTLPAAAGAAGSEAAR
jgi:signal transduction histidine kinase